MSVKILVDSGCDLSNEICELAGIDIESIPISVYLNDKAYTDDSKALEYVDDMRMSKSLPKSAAPSPDKFLDKFFGFDTIFIVTISSALSGTYNSAMTARNLYLEKAPDTFIYVFDSISASASETLIVLKICELVNAGLSNEEIVVQTNNFIKKSKTYFILENFDNLVKNGRVHPYLAKLSSLLSIRLICSNSSEGTIELIDKARGYNKAVNKLIDIIRKKDVNDYNDRYIGITHVNCLEKALQLKETIAQKFNFKKILVMEATILVSTYANEFGIIMAF